MTYKKAKMKSQSFCPSRASTTQINIEEFGRHATGISEKMESEVRNIHESIGEIR